MSTKYVSTSALAKEMNMQAKDLFQQLLEKGFINRDNDSWILTEQGKEVGGVIKTHPQHGSYIAWDENMKGLLRQEDEEGKGDKLVNATTLSKHFNVSKFRMNPILSELGMIQKSVKGWTLTNLGGSLGGKQFEYVQTGIPYVCWDESILTNKRLLETMQSVQGLSVNEEKEVKTTSSVGFREKFEAKLRAADGHYVRSRAEMLIDNWLYMSEIVHAYERKLPIEEELYCVFICQSVKCTSNTGDWKKMKNT
jgi:hypothetical protein